jgi:hypothetical protein
MYCPRCANQIAENQNFCRNCGLKLDVIVDAIHDKPRGQFDFESLKRDLRDLGSSMRSGWEVAQTKFKDTRKLKKNAPPQDWSREISKAVWSHEVSEVIKHHISKAIKKSKAARSRKYSFQQAALSIFGGGAIMTVWYYVLEAAANSGLLQNLELIIMDKTESPIFGLVPVVRMLWMLGLIPVARGVAHLINGIFFAPKPEREPEPQTGFSPDFAPTPAQNHIQSPPAFVSAVADPATNNLESEPTPQPQVGVTEDTTLRFEPK